MFRRFGQFSLLHGIKPECGIPSGPLTSLQIFRQYTGKGQQKITSTDVPDQMSFADFLKERRTQARRSFVARIPSNDWSPLLRICSKCGDINKVFHYRLNSHEFMLVEMSSEDELFHVLDHTQGSSIGCNQFVTCNRSRNEEDVNYKLNVQDLEKVSFNVSFKSNSIAILNKYIIRGNSVSTCLENIYNEIKLSDFALRLRFLMTRQLEALLGGLLPRTSAFPFGSTVTGLGAGKCDLDVVILPEEMKPSIFSRSDLWTADREKAQVHLSVIAEVMSCFLKGCNNLVFIRNARVPIVRYSSVFTSLQCDLSLYNTSAVAMSQILYIMSIIDERVRPLVIAIKLWAEKFDLAMKPSTNSLSNFSLTLLVIFFLQQKSPNFDAVLPPWNIFPTKSSSLFSEDQLNNCLKEFKMSCSENRRSLEELFLSFFIYYSEFDFKTNGLSLLSGQVIEKRHFIHFPIYIENPVAPDLNVCKHVNSNGVTKFRKLVREVCDIIKDDHFGLEDLYFSERRRKKVNVKTFVT